MDATEFILVILVMIFGLVVVVMGLVIMNQDKSIAELEMLYEMLIDQKAEDEKNYADGLGDHGMDIHGDMDDDGGNGDN